jgi:hypothetical protein
MDPLIYLIVGSFVLVIAFAAFWGRISYRNQLIRIATSRRRQRTTRPQNSLYIKRDGGRLWLRPLGIYVDGRKVGEVSPEEVKCFDVSPGEHSVEMRLDWLRSSIAVVNMISGQPCHLQCGIKKMFYEPNAPIFSYLIFHPRSVLYLEQIPFSGARTANRDKLIPLTIGFANLSGDDLVPLLTEDAAVLSGIFERTNIAPVTRFPSCEILFLYAHLREDGTLAGVDVPAGLRQVSQLTGAKIVVLASPNHSENAQKSAALPGQKSANLIVTLNRNGDGFGRFFGELFERMESGSSLMQSWVELAPQHSSAMPSYAPSTFLIAEAGDMRFPDSVPNPFIDTDAAR